MKIKISVFFITLFTLFLLACGINKPAQAIFECRVDSDCASDRYCEGPAALWSCLPYDCFSSNQDQSFCRSAISVSYLGGSNWGANNHDCAFLNNNDLQFDGNGNAVCCFVLNYYAQAYPVNHTTCIVPNCAGSDRNDPNRCIAQFSTGTCAGAIGGYSVSCNGSPVYGSCGGGVPYNRCGWWSGSQSITYTSLNYCNTTLTSGGSTNPNDFSPGNRCNASTTSGGCSFYRDNCDGGNGYTCRNGNSCQRDCNTGTTGCGTCAGGSEPVNTCNLLGTNIGSQTCTHDTWNGQAGCNAQNFTNTCTYSYNNCSGAYTCNNGNSCQTSISGNVWKDYDHNASNNSEPGFQGVTVSLNTGATTTTDANGNYTFTGIVQGNYTVTVTVPGGYDNTTNTSIAVSLAATATNASTGNNFGLTPLYTISGLIYNDVNKDMHYQAGTDVIHAGDSVTITGPNSYNQTLNAGSYTTGQALVSGAYTITYNGPPTGWKIVYPGPPATLVVQVGLPASSDTGHVCSTNSYNDVACDTSGNISNANIGISNENSFVIGPCSDLRTDGTMTNNGDTTTGFTDPLPQAPNSGITCGSGASATDPGYAIPPISDVLVSGSSVGGATISCTTPGIVFSGASVPDYGFGQASPNPYDWSVGGGTPLTESFSPVNPTIVRTSYTYMSTTAQQSGIDLTTAAHNLNNFCTGGLNNCTLSASLPDNVYLANGNVYLNSFSFPTNKSYVILVNGDLHIMGNITVPIGSTATFSVKGNIYVDPSVGTTSTDTTSNIAGLFSADQSFIIQSSYTLGSACNADGTPKDLRLNVQGSVIVNAALGGGSFINQRDLCKDDLMCPTYMVAQRPDFILNAPDFIKHKNVIWQEQAP